MSRLSRAVPARRERIWWAPHRATWWISVLFAMGSMCFVVAPLPIFFDRVGARTDAAVFFGGSLFFTTAAALDWLETINVGPEPATASRATPIRVLAWDPRRIDFWSSGLQLLGTLLFNISTFRALTTAVDQPSYDHVVWRPDAYGSICFLVSGYLAYVEVVGALVGRVPRTREGAVVSVNLFGCFAFGVSAVAGYVLPSTGDPVDVTLADAATSLGALGFLVGAVLLLPVGARARG